MKKFEIYFFRLGLRLLKHRLERQMMDQLDRELSARLEFVQILLDHLDKKDRE
jgi:hypothetical protein